MSSSRLSPFIQIARNFPEDAKLMVRELNSMAAEVAYGINARDIGIYINEEIPNGQRFGLDSINPAKGVLRKVVEFSTIGNGTTSVAHGITISATTRFTRIYGAANNPSTLFIPLPFINVSAPADSVQLQVGPTNVNLITTTANYASYSAYVILEYIQ